MIIPELTTERLLLRAHVATDLDALAAMWTDPVVYRFVGNKPSTREQSWARLLRYLGHWHAMGYGSFAAIERRTNRYVGELGVMSFCRDLDPAAAAALAPHEAGWILASWAHGQGFATEGVRAALAWHDAQFGGEPTGCVIDSANTASVHVATKLGFREVLRTTYRDEPIIVSRRDR